MQIDLFTCTAEHNRVNKSDYISNRFTMDGYLRKQTSALDIIVEVEKTNPVIYKYNYMYISEFGRYYFITDIQSVNNKIWQIHATTDVLMSFKSDILSTYAIIDKTEQDAHSNLYLDDGSFVMDTRKYNEIKEFPSGLSDTGYYVLICAGGV